VRRAYELSGETVDSIARRCGMSRATLWRRHVAQGWTTRSPVAVYRGGSGAKIAGAEGSEFRLNRLILVGAAMLAKRLKAERLTEEGLTQASARMLTELCRAEELRMRAMRQKTGKTRETKKDAATDFRDDPVWLDAELRRWLDSLTQGGDQGAPRDGDERGEAGLSRELAI
jgi:hypothetical protein